MKRSHLPCPMLLCSTLLVIPMSLGSACSSSEAREAAAAPLGMSTTSPHDVHAQGHGRGNGEGQMEGHREGQMPGHMDGHGPAAHHSQGPNVGHGHGDSMPHRFDDAAAWSARFDAPERDTWQKPDDVVAALKLPTDAIVADLGAGTGYFAVRLARAVPKGRVLGVDVEESMVRFMDERAAKEGLTNLKGRLTPFDRADVDDGTDLVLVVDTYHHINDRVPYFKALATKLSARGRLAIVDFRLGSERGPPKDHKLGPDAVHKELIDAGYVEVASHDFLPDQYFLVFAPKR